jgi:serine phosphatase RsbU (regulator of sigma subunit)
LLLTQDGQAVLTEVHPVTLALEHQSNSTGLYEFHQAERVLILEVSWSCFRLKDQGNSAVLVIHDITEHQKAQKELRQHRENLQELVEERTAQLAQANAKIQTLNERLKAENLRMSAELEVTRQLQQMILPKEHELSQIAGLEITEMVPIG